MVTDPPKVIHLLKAERTQRNPKIILPRACSPQQALLPPSLLAVPPTFCLTHLTQN